MIFKLMVNMIISSINYTFITH